MTTSHTPVRAAGAALLSIGDLARHTGVSPRSLRYYEEQGLLPARRTAAGHRRYAQEAIGRVELIQRFFSAGLASSEIGPLLPGMTAEDGATGEAVAALHRCRDRLRQEVTRQLDTIDILDEVLETQQRA